MANKVTRGQAAQPGDVRSVLLWLHRWIGLTLGMIFAVVALSGSLLLFQAQYFTWAHGEMIPENLSPEPRFIDRWVENARAALPDAQKLSPIVIWPPHIDHNVSDAGSVVFGGREPGGLGNMGLVSVLVAPNTGEVLGVVDIDRTPVYAPIFLHRDLWAGEGSRSDYCWHHGRRCAHHVAARALSLVASPGRATQTVSAPSIQPATCLPIAPLAGELGAVIPVRPGL